MKFSINIYQDEDGVYIAECPSVPGCVSQGSTMEEAENNVKDAIKECIEVRRELNMPLIVHSKEVEVSI
jgi:predicted RNase H-like HicB family nuclease